MSSTTEWDSWKKQKSVLKDLAYKNNTLRFTLSRNPLALKETIEIDIQKNRTRDNRTKISVVKVRTLKGKKSASVAGWLTESGKAKLRHKLSQSN